MQSEMKTVKLSRMADGSDADDETRLVFTQVLSRHISEPSYRLMLMADLGLDLQLGVVRSFIVD